VAASSATTDGSDALSSSVLIASTGIDVSAALFDGADVAAAQVGVRVAASSASTDGADALAAAIAVVVAASLATTDGADVLGAAAAVQVSASLARTDGADVLAAQVALAAGALEFSAALADGADVLQAAIGTSTAAGGYDKPKRKKRFVVEQDGKLLVFGSARAAVEALGQQKAIEAVAVEPPAEELAVAEISLPAVQAYAEVRGLVDDYQAALRNRHYLALIDMFRDMRDEEDVELLLMHA
jgi:hypothetical protein